MQFVIVIISQPISKNRFSYTHMPLLTFPAFSRAFLYVTACPVNTLTWNNPAATRKGTKPRIMTVRIHECMKAMINASNNPNDVSKRVPKRVPVA